MNKEATGDTVSLLLQKAFSGRAEIGLIGDDDLLFKVSPDGSAWVDALKVDKTSGKLTTLGQIQFPATQNPSSDANCLDDYEEGTFTPGASFGGGMTGIAYSLQSGKYTKIGNGVLYGFEIRLTSKGSDVGGFRATGLPFTVTSVSVIGAPWCTNMAATVGDTHLSASAVVSTTQCDMNKQAAGSVVVIDDTDFTNTSRVRVAGHYHN
jgi:hypothetical protein